MSLNIKPRLQTIMDHYVAIGCHTFSTDEPDHRPNLDRPIQYNGAGIHE
jgi:hypothetical protein